jgi:hypothetical protein
MPVDTGSEVLKVPPDEVHCFTPSTHTYILVTVAADSVLPAEIFTGEVTVEFGAGAQIVTEGSIGLKVQGGGEFEDTVT